jgi:hypothetical protein
MYKKTRVVRSSNIEEKEESEAAGGGNGKAVGGHLRLILWAWHW